MPFIYESKVGQQRYITGKSLKKKLITFSGSEYDEANVQLYTSDTAQLLEFFEKLGINQPKIMTYDNIQSLIASKFKEHMDEVPVLLTMERIHFMSIIYLLRENIASIDEIIKMLNMPFYTRTEYLLRYLSRENEYMLKFDSLFSNFYENIESLVDNGFTEKEDMSSLDDIVMPYAEVRVNNLEVDVFLKTIVKTLEASSTLTNIVDPVETDWGDALTFTTLFSHKLPYESETVIVDNYLGVVGDTLTYTTNSTLSVLNDCNNPAIPEQLKFYASNKFINAYFETVMAPHIRSAFIRRDPSRYAKHSNIVAEYSTLFYGNSQHGLDINLTSILDITTEDIFKYALDLNGTYDFIYYGEYLKNAYVNTGSYFTSISGTLTPYTFSTPYVFDFITDAKTKELLEKIFPTIVDYNSLMSVPVPYTLESSDYFRRYFLTRKNFDNDYDYTSFYNTSIKTKVLDESGNTIPTILKNLDMIILNNSVSIAGSNHYKLRYINPQYISNFKNVLAKVLNDNAILILDLDAVDIGWITGVGTSVFDYLTALIALIPDIRTEIAALNNYEVSISLNMYTDIFKNYLNYLLGTNTYTFNKILYVTADSYSNYRIINFVQQTFASTGLFFEQLKKLKYYDLYLLFFGLFSNEKIMSFTDYIEFKNYGSIPTNAQNSAYANYLVELDGYKYFYNYTLDKHNSRQQIRDVM